jgi:triacylglycerol esterase/lipase EstA (alpha/beta hydrolase family)
MLDEAKEIPVYTRAVALVSLLTLFACAPSDTGSARQAGARAPGAESNAASPQAGVGTAATEGDLKRVHVNGVELHYVERGKGEPIVFVHGGLADYREWVATMKPLSRQYRTIAYSRRYNYPNRNPELRPDHSASVEAEDLAALIRELDLAPAHVAALSYGAYTALLLAVDHPELIRTLIPGGAAGAALARAAAWWARRVQALHE